LVKSGVGLIIIKAGLKEGEKDRAFDWMHKAPRSIYGKEGR
jgi:hypothetical protein